MMDNIGLKEKIQTELGNKGVPVSDIWSVQGIYSALPVNALKLIGNIVGDGITEKSVNGECYRKKAYDCLYEIISLATEVAAQGA